MEKCILIGIDTGEYNAEESLEELEELTHTAGAECVAQAIQRRESMDPATCIGAGKLEEIATIADELEADLVIFDCELSATQLRNIEKICGIRVIDRTTLILDIFAMRAHSAEGKLQVELAQQKYRLPRLAGMGTVLSRLGGGIGTRGPGESQLESDRRHIRRRITALNEQLEQLSLRRERSRERRSKDGVLTAAIVGYTNAGKSTLLNCLTDAGVLSEDKLFATLDTTSRGITLPDGRLLILIDTVGLIRRLPHQLVEAFKSTLEEAASADILLHVVDASAEDAREKADVTRRLLSELGCDGIEQITIFNKCDCLGTLPPVMKEDRVVAVSAKEGSGIDDLLGMIVETLPVTSKRLSLLLPYGEAGVLDRIRQTGVIYKEDYLEDGIKVDALVDRTILSSVEKYAD